MKIHAPGLAGWLAIATALLVTLAVAVVSIVGVRLLHDLAEADGRTRVALAVSDAREVHRQSTEDLLTATQVLGERPTLRRLLRNDDIGGLDPYLARYCEGAALHACAVVRDGAPIVATGLEADWQRVLAAGAEQGELFMVTGAVAGVALAGARSPVPDGDDELEVYAVRKMDAEHAERLGERAGVEIRIVDYASFKAGEGDFSVLNSDALARGEPVSGYLGGLDAYGASLPIVASTGETVGLLQAILPASAVMGPVEKMNRRMLRVSIAVALLATLSGILIGRHWIGGVQRLTKAARRLGSGDLAASIPPAGGKELSILASTMEDMRRNLVDLTGELRKREAEAQAVLGGIVEGVYAVDAERRIRFMNPQAERLLKTSSADAIGKFCGDLLKPARDPEGRRPCEHACPIVKARQAGSAEAVEQIKPRGRQHRVVIASSAPGDGMQVQVLRDETELEAVRRTRDTVLANISHEFRTPLAAQLASIELLRDGLGKMAPAAQQQLVFSLERGAQRLTWLIDNLLESVRIESGQLGIRHQDVDLAEVVRAARELIEPLLHQRGQALEVRIPAGLPVLWGDEQRLVQVVVNLLANASKFGPPDSTIRIGARASANGGVEFWVDDAGPGPADPDDDALFEQFRRSGGEDPEESGLGLGLFIVRSIVERHGGEVSLGRGPESGTRARVELPAESPA